MEMANPYPSKSQRQASKVSSKALKTISQRTSETIAIVRSVAITASAIEL